MIVDNRSTQICAFLFPVVGPLFCLAAFLIARDKTFTLDLWLFATLSAFLFFKEKRQGFAISLIGFVLIASARLALTKDIFWELGLDLSIGFALFLTYEGSAFAETFIKKMRQEKEDAKEKAEEIVMEMRSEKERYLIQQEAFQDQTAVYKKKIEGLEEKLQSLNTLCATLSETMELHTQFKEELEKRSRKALFSLNAEEKKNRYLSELIKELQQSETLKKESILFQERWQEEKQEKKEQEQLKERYFDLYKKALDAKEQLEEREKEKEEELRLWKAKASSIKSDEHLQEELKKKQMAFAAMQKEYEELKERYLTIKVLFDEQALQVKELLHTKASYLQLKKQFKEKNLLLHKTRKEIFSYQTKLEVMEKEAFEKELEERAVWIEDFEEENEKLLELIEALLPKPEIKAYQEKLF